MNASFFIMRAELEPLRQNEAADARKCQNQCRVRWFGHTGAEPEDTSNWKQGAFLRTKIPKKKGTAAELYQMRQQAVKKCQNGDPAKQPRTIRNGLFLAAGLVPQFDQTDQRAVWHVPH